ncbi:MAG: hypothetical protein AAGD13_07970 [Pseudomonadota bacterium]
MKPLRWIMLCALALSLPLAACGKKGSPKPPSQVEAESKEKEAE